MKSKNIILFFFMIIYCSNIIGQANDKDVQTSIDSIFEHKMNKAGIVGAGAAIIVNKKLVWTSGYGYADQENKIPFTPLTIINIASISKTFTGFCTMKAFEEGKVLLDEDINHYLPFRIINPYFPNDKITLRHLATHTSSLSDRYPFYTDSTYFYGSQPEPLDEFIKNYFVPGGKYYSKDNFINAKPGAYRDYSNIGAGLAGYIIELRTGKKLSDYAKLHIFQPLEMSNSGWDLDEINIQNHSKLYKQQGDSIVQIQLYEGITYPDGGIRTSVYELSNFFICLLNNGRYKNKKLLKTETVKEMLRFQFTETNKPENVELKSLNSGIFWATKLGATRIGHNGSDPGVRTFMLSDLSKEIGIILFFNTSLNEEQESIYFEIYDEIYQYAQKVYIRK